MNKLLLILTILSCLIIPAYAGTSTSFINSIEVFGGGGGEKTSTSYKLHAKTRGMGYGSRVGTTLRLGEGFSYAAYNASSTQPQITSVSPASAPNTGRVNITIRGVNFTAGALVRLVRSGHTTITGESVTVVDPTRIDCTLNITGIAEGSWTIEIENPDGSIARLVNGFVVTVPSEKVDIIGTPVNYPNPFDPDKGPTTIKFTLNRDAGINLYIHNISGTRIWEEHYSGGTNGGKTGVNEVLWDGYTAFSQEVPNGIYVYQITSGGRTLATGKIAVFR